MLLLLPELVVELSLISGRVSTDGENFANVTTGANGTTATYTTAATAAGDNGNKFRCKINTTAGAPEVVSNVATLTVT